MPNYGTSSTGIPGRAENWYLVKYEMARISESLRKAALLYSNIPIESVTGMSQPLNDMRGGGEGRSQIQPRL